jgi:hypothetical protein
MFVCFVNILDNNYLLLVQKSPIIYFGINTQIS